MTGSVTVAICARNRPDALLRCLRSLSGAAPIIREAIVLDDGSPVPLRDQVEPALESVIPVRWLRNESGHGPAAGRNEIARLAGTEFLLGLDDDAFLLDDSALRQALAVLAGDPTVGVIGFAQADEDGTPWPPELQPAVCDGPCVVAAFTAYGFVVRREAFLAAGGFLGPMEQNGEEKDLCLRLLDDGYRVVYLPQARVGHVTALAGRDSRRYLHQIVRNEVLSAAHSIPAPLWPALALGRLLRYFPMRRGWQIDDPGGMGEVLRVIGRRLPAVLRARRPVRWRTLRRWREVAVGPQPYTPP